MCLLTTITCSGNETNILVYLTVVGRPFRGGNILLEVQENMSSLLLLLLPLLLLLLVLLLLLLLLWLILMLLILLLMLSFSAILTLFIIINLTCKMWLSHSRFAVNSRPRRTTLHELFYLQHSVAMVILTLAQDLIRHGVKFQKI